MRSMSTSLVICLLLGLSEAGPKHIYIFGNSLTDVGNSYVLFGSQTQFPITYNSQHSNPVLSLPFAMTTGPYDIESVPESCRDEKFGDSDGLLTFSNGKSLSQLLSEKAGLKAYPSAVGGDVFAVGGGTLGFYEDAGYDRTLSSQIDALLLRPKEDIESSHSMFVVYLGGNDLITSTICVVEAFLSNNLEQVPACFDSTTNGDLEESLIENFSRLASLGSGHFVLVAPPDITTTPFFKILSNVAGPSADMFKATIDGFRGQLTEAAMTAAGTAFASCPRCKTKLIDLSQANDNMADAGLVDMDNQAISPCDAATSDCSQIDICSQISVEGKVFLDAVHLTEAANEVVAQYFFEEIIEDADFSRFAGWIVSVKFIDNCEPSNAYEVFARRPEGCNKTPRGLGDVDGSWSTYCDADGMEHSSIFEDSECSGNVALVLERQTATECAINDKEEYERHYCDGITLPDDLNPFSVLGASRFRLQTSLHTDEECSDESLFIRKFNADQLCMPRHSSDGVTSERWTLQSSSTTLIEIFSSSDCTGSTVAEMTASVGDCLQLSPTVWVKALGAADDLPTPECDGVSLTDWLSDSANRLTSSIEFDPLQCKGSESRIKCPATCDADFEPINNNEEVVFRCVSDFSGRFGKVWRIDKRQSLQCQASDPREGQHCGQDNLEQYLRINHFEVDSCSYVPSRGHRGNRGIQCQQVTCEDDMNASPNSRSLVYFRCRKDEDTGIKQWQHTPSMTCVDI